MPISVNFKDLVEWLEKQWHRPRAIISLELLGSIFFLWKYTGDNILDLSSVELGLLLFLAP
jgi:hypothetical protein